MTVRKRKTNAAAAAKPQVFEARFRPYDDIESDLNGVKCALACASFALGQAQDTDDGALGAKAWAVIHSCAKKLERLEDDLDSWFVNHEHSPKVVAHG